MSGGSTPAGDTGREELDECQEGVQQLVLQAESNLMNVRSEYTSW
jgi:hypothetical protein